MGTVRIPRCARNDRPLHWPPSYYSDPLHFCAHFTENNPGSAVNPMPVNLRVPDVATNALSLDNWFVAGSYRTVVPSSRRFVVSDAMTTLPCASNAPPGT